jgi:hypothetical protein
MTAATIDGQEYWGYHASNPQASRSALSRLFVCQLPFLSPHSCRSIRNSNAAAAPLPAVTFTVNFTAPSSGSAAGASGFTIVQSEQLMSSPQKLERPPM